MKRWKYLTLGWRTARSKRRYDLCSCDPENRVAAHTISRSRKSAIELHMPFRLELNRTRRPNIAPLEATGIWALAPSKSKATALTLSSKAILRRFKSLAVALSRLRHIPAILWTKSRSISRTRTPKFAIITFCLIVIRLCFQTGHPAKARIPAKW